MRFIIYFIAFHKQDKEPVFEMLNVHENGWRAATYRPNQLITPSWKQRREHMTLHQNCNVKHALFVHMVTRDIASIRDKIIRGSSLFSFSYKHQLQSRYLDDDNVRNSRSTGNVIKVPQVVVLALLVSSSLLLPIFYYWLSIYIMIDWQNR